MSHINSSADFAYDAAAPPPSGAGRIVAVRQYQLDFSHAMDQALEGAQGTLTQHGAIPELRYFLLTSGQDRTRVRVLNAPISEAGWRELTEVHVPRMVSADGSEVAVLAAPLREPAMDAGPGRRPAHGIGLYGVSSAGETDVVFVPGGREAHPGAPLAGWSAIGPVMVSLRQAVGFYENWSVPAPGQSSPLRPAVLAFRFADYEQLMLAEMLTKHLIEYTGNLVPVETELARGGRVVTCVADCQRAEELLRVTCRSGEEVTLPEPLCRVALQAQDERFVWLDGLFGRRPARAGARNSAPRKNNKPRKRAKRRKSKRR